MKSFLLIGMGTLGHHLCRSLAEYRCEIMIVDSNAAKLEDLLPYVASAKVGDCTNPALLESLDVPSFDACFVCIGENFQNSLEVTSLLKDAGAKKVFSRADEDIQAKFLLRCGADEVIYPEKDIARRIARSESSDSIFDFIELSADCSIYEIEVNPKWVGKTIGQLDFRRRYNLSILALKKGASVTPVTNPDHMFTSDEHLYVLGYPEDINRVIR